MGLFRDNHGGEQGIGRIVWSQRGDGSEGVMVTGGAVLGRIGDGRRQGGPELFEQGTGNRGWEAGEVLGAAHEGDPTVGKEANVGDIYANVKGYIRRHAVWHRVTRGHTVDDAAGAA